MNEKYIISLIGRIHRQANNSIERELKKHKLGGIAPSHGDILFQLYKNKSVTMQQLAQLIDRDKSTVTVLVNKLVKLGYINKTPDAQDARIYNFSATQKGRELRPIFEEISNRLLTRVYCEFESKEKEVIIQLLQKIKLK
jgi:DNA-binding MarR family transcriptional regulator